MGNGLIRRIAWRYLRGKRGGNAVPILSRIAMLALAVGSAALIILFSVFNGFEQVVGDLYKAFYPDIRITAARGKFFDPAALPKSIYAVKGVETGTPVIEDNALVNREDEQVVVAVKGIQNEYFTVNRVSEYITDGRNRLTLEPMPTAIIGSGVASQMGLDVENAFSRLLLHYPNPDIQGGPVSPQDAFQSIELKPDGVFRVQEEFDSRYVLAPLGLVQELLHREGRISSLEIKLQPRVRLEEVKKELQQLVGPDFKVETRFEQNRLLYGVMRSEKWATYAILLFVLLIASVNLTGALLLLVLEKQQDAAILVAMGATGSFLRRLFLSEGLLWAGLGGTFGLLLGSLLVLGQMRFGWVRMGESFIINAYPVQLRATDIPVVFFTVILVGLLAALYPAARAARITAEGLRGN